MEREQLPAMPLPQRDMDPVELIDRVLLCARVLLSVLLTLALLQYCYCL